MQISRLSKNCLSIYLNAADLNEFGITYENLDILSPQTRTVIKKLLENALSQTGFEAEGQRLLVEAYPVEDDACLILFTICEAVESEEWAESAEPTLFLFNSFTSLIAACRELKNSIPSSLFWHKNQYILVLWILPSQYDNICEQLLKFAKVPSDSQLLLAELQEENSVLIKENAVKILSANF